MRLVFFAITACIISTTLCAQPRVFTATRTLIPVKMDGVLNDTCWNNSFIAKDFVTNEPEFGKPASQETEVRFLYDDEAIYVGYFLYDDDVAKITRILTERDKSTLVDEIMIGIDPYNNKTTAFRFQVTAAGVQSDRFMSPNIPSTDKSWDAVWESEVSIDGKGWYAELKIPFSALRFPQKPVQEWNIQFGRYVARSGEFTTWSPVNSNIGGPPMRQWGLLNGIENVDPKPRLSLSPYFTSGIQKVPAVNSDPTSNAFYTGGMDLRYGISQSHTLDMVLIPDFSQVQYDNTVLNLTPFEVRYDERRQFFTEGTDMFSKAGIFYSRRIGNIPSGYSSVSELLQSNERILENPSITRIVNATKVSGRNRHGLGIGVLNAITQEMHAEVINDSARISRRIRTEPLTNYNVTVFDQTLKGNSKIGLITTSVMRNGGAVDAIVSALDFILTSKNNAYALSGTGIRSYRKGTSLSGGHQAGYSYSIDFARISGNYRFQANHKAVHKEFNPNDLGFFAQTNLMETFFALKYYSYTPKGDILNWNSILSHTHVNTLETLEFQEATIDWTSYFLFKNFATLNVALESNPVRSIDIYEPRSEGKYFVRPKALKASLTASTDTRKKFQMQCLGAVKWFEFPERHLSYEAGLTPQLRAGRKAIVSVSARYIQHLNNQGYVSTGEDGSIFFGQRNEQSVDCILTCQYLFTSQSNLSVRVRDYWSSVGYTRYNTLRDDGYLDPATYDGNASIDLHIFNVDMIYSWQYAPGSFLSVSWKNDISLSDKSGGKSYFQSVYDTLQVPHGNTISLRIIYYLDYVKLKEIF